MKGKGLNTLKEDVREWVVKRTKSGAVQQEEKQPNGALEEKRGNKSSSINKIAHLSVSSTDSNAKPLMDGMNVSGGLPPPPPAKITFSAKGATFRVDTRYSFIKALGHGAYGVVCSATDSRTNSDVAIKKVAGVFDDQTDAKRIIREVRLLSSMRHDNILSITDIDGPEVYSEFNDVYLMTELMDTDLNKLLRSKHPLLDAQRKFFSYQLFRALKYIHSANILHRDLKPANVLVSENVSRYCEIFEHLFIEMRSALVFSLLFRF